VTPKWRDDLVRVIWRVLSLVKKDINGGKDVVSGKWRGFEPWLRGTQQKQYLVSEKVVWIITLGQWFVLGKTSGSIHTGSRRNSILWFGIYLSYIC